MSQVELIQFALVNVNTEQFAVIESVEIDESKMGVQYGSTVSTNYINKAIRSSFKTVFMSGDEPFMIVEGSAHFVIADESWKSCIVDDKGTVELPKDFIAHIISIAVGLTRGILHAKTTDTGYCKYFIPLVNLDDLGIEELTIDPE